MASFGYPALFEGTVANGATQYVPVPVREGTIGLYIAWTDATSSATITLELTSMSSVDAPVTTAGTYQWKDSGETITGPAASAAGASMVNLGNVRQHRGRLKIVAAANCAFKIYDGTNRP